MKRNSMLALLLLSALLTLSTTALASNQEYRGQFTRDSRCEDQSCEKLTIYVIDDDGNYFREVICQDGRVFYETISAEEYIEYLYGTIPAGYSVVRDGRYFIISSGDFGDDKALDRSACEPNAHGISAHVMKYELLPGGSMYKATCASKGCGYSFTGYIE